MSEPDVAQIEQAAGAAQRFRRRQWHAMTPTQRMELSAQIQRTAFETLRSNPAAYQAFVRRNHHQRRISNVERLEAVLLGRMSVNDE